MNSNTFSLSQLVRALFRFLLNVGCYYAPLRDEQVLMIKKRLSKLEERSRMVRGLQKFVSHLYSSQ